MQLTKNKILLDTRDETFGPEPKPEWTLLFVNLKLSQLQLYLHTQDAKDYIFLLNRALLGRNVCSLRMLSSHSKNKKTTENRNQRCVDRARASDLIWRIRTACISRCGSVSALQGMLGSGFEAQL